jgi:hypothetical protein
MSTISFQSFVKTNKHDQFHTFTRIQIKTYYLSDHSQKQIVRLLKEQHNVEISQETISRIINFAYERRRKHKSNRLRKLSSRTTRYLTRVISREWSKRRLIWKQLVISLDFNVSDETIRRTLRKLDYRRCIACERSFISEKQAKKRLKWAQSISIEHSTSCMIRSCMS